MVLINKRHAFLCLSYKMGIASLLGRFSHTSLGSLTDKFTLLLRHTQEYAKFQRAYVGMVTKLHLVVLIDMSTILDVSCQSVNLGHNQCCINLLAFSQSLNKQRTI